MEIELSCNQGAKASIISWWIFGVESPMKNDHEYKLCLMHLRKYSRLPTTWVKKLPNLDQKIILRMEILSTMLHLHQSKSSRRDPFQWSPYCFNVFPCLISMFSMNWPLIKPIRPCWTILSTVKCCWIGI